MFLTAGLHKHGLQMVLESSLLLQSLNLPSNSESYFSSLPLSTMASWQQPLRQKNVSIEATFTPTAAGLRSGTTQELQIPASMGALISVTIKQGIAAILQQSQRAASVHSEHPLPPDLHQLAQASGENFFTQEPYTPDSSNQSPLEEETHRDLELSEDEGLMPDQPAFAGLFCPSLFKSLLFKAKNTARLGTHLPSPDPTSETADAKDSLFSEPTTEAEVVPSPRLFLDVVQRQWASPGTGSNPSNLDKKFYKMGPDLSKALPEHRQYLSFSYGRQHYQYRVLPFVILSVPRAFMKLLAALAADLEGLPICIQCYLDDTLIQPASDPQAREDLRITIQVLQDNGFFLNTMKSHLSPTD